eukprot:CAMPEP_0203954782 /NCGR_PEP_ID=MMETSP0359-20131031/87638_1 /ASSEMBLY_ACC=CAM_ASM_000338 /TAXON_ID=268821 /ORGANISM="Scrippsiella Hangoei, Strain SHTV-5" /LENGTH=515 /DNA_ID=CAMNT_0050888317 /DNA_START=10 /DNA_END=1557 /DNA_ORIENTATION=+
MAPQRSSIEAWYMAEDVSDQTAENRCSPNRPADHKVLTDLGVLSWNLSPEGYSYPPKAVPWNPEGIMDPDLNSIRTSRGYNYADIITCSEECLPDYHNKLKMFFEEHIHSDEEVRYILSGSGYFDVRDRQDKWIRVKVQVGDLMVLPEGIYHRFTMDDKNFTQAMRLFKGEPVWTPINRPADDNGSRQKYVEQMARSTEPKARTKAAKAAKVAYDYSGLKEGMRVQAESHGLFYAAEIVQVSESKSRTRAPVKISYKGYDKADDEWVGGNRLKCKALKKVRPEVEERPPLQFTFGYWKIRGLGAIFRMIFEYKGIEYSDNQYESNDQWFKEDKPKILEKTPLANLPYVECGTDCVCQTNACLSYVGSRLRLNGGGRQAQLLNEQLLCEIYDVRNAIIELSYPFATVCRSETEHNEKAAKHLESNPFKKFEASLEKSGTEFFCGKGPCTADFHIWEMMDQHRLLAEKHKKGDVFASIPKCKAFYDRFRALPQLQKYFESDAYKLPVNSPLEDAYFQ